MMSSTSATPKYKLIYYPLRGRGEILRFIFAHLEIPYEDARISPEEWAKMKPDSLFGTIPMLEFLETGKKLSSSVAIARLFAEEHGLAGANAFENAELFSIVDATSDAWVHIYDAVFWEKNEERKAMLVKKLHEDYLPAHTARFERRAASNGAQEGWIHGDKFTYADIATYLLFDYLVRNIPGSLETYPTLAKQRESIHKMKNIGEWIKKRPVTSL